MVGLALMVTNAALTPTTAKQLEGTPFYGLFVLHAVLVIFLIGWWAASGRPPLKEFLNIRHERPAEVVAIGTAVGVGGWMITLTAALVATLILRGVGAMDTPPEPPAMIGWMANLALWKKALIVLSAMTLAHFTYGNPLLLIGVTVVSLVIGITFYRTKNVVPGVIAHGVFDAIQLFVIVPLAVRMMGM
jgi:hypothetical protein